MDHYGARIFLSTALVVILLGAASSEAVQIFHDRATGISVMVPAGYLASSKSANKNDLTIRLELKDSIANYCDLRFTRTTVPDKWARDKSKRTLHERFRTMDRTEGITLLQDNREIWRLDPKIVLPSPSSKPSPWLMPPPSMPPSSMPPSPPPQAKLLNMQLRAPLNYISAICSAKLEEYDKYRPIFEAVIKSIDVPY